MQNFHLVNLFIRAEHEHENLIKIRINPHGVCHVVNRIREKVSVENQRFSIEQPGMRYKKYSLTFVRSFVSRLHRWRKWLQQTQATTALSNATRCWRFPCMKISGSNLCLFLGALCSVLAEHLYEYIACCSRRRLLDIFIIPILSLGWHSCSLNWYR